MYSGHCSIGVGKPVQGFPRPARSALRPGGRSRTSIKLGSSSTVATGDQRDTQVVVSSAVFFVFLAVFAVALGFIVRSTAGGIATLFGLLLVLPGIGQVLPASWQRHTLPYLPSNAGSSMFTITPEDPSALSPGMGLLVLCLWVAAALVAAAVLVRRRDA